VIVAKEIKQGHPASPPWLVPVVVIDVLIAAGVFVVVAIVAPDGGPTGISLRQGLVLALVFAAAPIAALARGTSSASLLALGGGMMVAGVATAPGGNILGPVMAVSGLLLLLVGGSGQPKLTARLIGSLLLYGIMLYAGSLLAVDTMILSGLLALILAVVIALSTHWRRLEPDRS
jgi:hypothetical protein